jgi:hypothetical protein
MGADYLVQLSCGPRKAFAGDDVREGSLRIMSMVKAESRAALLMEQARKSGQDPATMSMKLMRLLPSGPVESELRVADLVAEAAPLRKQAASCNGCPANVSNEPYGCYGSIRYPIPESSEAWLMDHVQGPGSVGGELLFRAIEDFGYDGAIIKRYRERNLMQRTAPVRTWKTGFLSKKTVSADQIWHALFNVGDLQPAHAQMMLLCLGMLRDSDGKILGSPEAKLDAETPSNDPGIAALQQFFTALYVAWRTDSTVLVDA